MQHRYAGDIGDYLKFSLLRAIGQGHKVGVAWWLHPDEAHNGDGRHVAYLRNPERWRALDPQLFDEISEFVQGAKRSVAALQDAGSLASFSFASDPIPLGVGRQKARTYWLDSVVEELANCDLLFVDPDNGIDLSDVVDDRASPKHVTLKEIGALRAKGRTIVVYHHQTRRPGGHNEEIRYVASRFQDQGFDRVLAVRARAYSPRVFFVLEADNQVRTAAKAMAKMSPDVFECFEFEPFASIKCTGWPVTLITLYPEMFPGPLGHSLAGRALAEGVWSLDAVQLRDFAKDKHRSVDDTPAGGGPGMVLRADVLAAAVDAARARQPDAPVLAMSPRGAALTQARVRALAAGPGVTILCGRFEGFDERIFEGRGVEPVSVGDYVLSGGEPAAIVLLDACVRLLPGVMGAASSGEQESFEDGLLEHPHYTRPQMWEGRDIPQVLRSGDHAKIDAWRLAQAEIDTRLRRPDLWERHEGARVMPPSGARREKKREI